MKYRIFERYHAAPPELANLTALQALAIAEALKPEEPDAHKKGGKRERIQ